MYSLMENSVDRIIFFKTKDNTTLLSVANLIVLPIMKWHKMYLIMDQLLGFHENTISMRTQKFEEWEGDLNKWISTCSKVLFPTKKS